MVLVDSVEKMDGEVTSLIREMLIGIDVSSAEVLNEVLTTDQVVVCYRRGSIAVQERYETN